MFGKISEYYTAIQHHPVMITGSNQISCKSNGTSATIGKTKQ